MNRRLILVRHSLPEFVPSLPANSWHLSEEGRQRCHLLAQKLAIYRPADIVSSLESKAQETAQIVAEDLGLSYRTVAGLHEHERDADPDFNQAVFETRVAAFFANPNQVIYGKESADQTYARFSLAVSEVISNSVFALTASQLIVAHGTVISLFMARRCHLEPFPLWKSLGMPAFAILSLPDYRFLHLEESILAS